MHGDDTSGDTPGGAIPGARFEFRAFGQDLDRVRFRLGRLSSPVPEALWDRRSDEWYIVSRANDLNNAKVRAGKIDIKTLVRTIDGLEQWNPLMKGDFPLPASVLREEVFPALGVELPPLPDGPCPLDEFLRIVRHHPALAVVGVGKRRSAYLVHGTTCEYAEVLLNGARLETVSAESTDIDALKRTIADTGMHGLENVNYVQAIKRVIGMVRSPLAGEAAPRRDAVAREIERKFLVTGPFRDDAMSSTRIVQGYLSSVPERAVRVRTRGPKGSLTIKGIGDASGASRLEWEREIPLAEAEALLALCEPGVIDKVRHLVPVGDHTFEVDEFRGENEGLVVAELELGSATETFPRPAWLGAEVTGDPRYYNAMLAKMPYRRWSGTER